MYPFHNSQSVVFPQAQVGSQYGTRVKYNSFEETD